VDNPSLAEVRVNQVESSSQRRTARLILLGFALAAPFVTAGMLLSLARMRNDVTGWLPKTYAETQQFIHFIQHFDPEAFVLVSWEGCTLDDPRVPRLAEALVGSPSLESGASKSPYFSKVITGPSLLETLVSPPINLSYEKALSRLSGSLIGPDLHSTCVVFSMTPGGVANMRDALSELKTVASRACGLTPDDLKLGGPPVDNVALDVAGEQSMLRVLGLTTICGLLVSWWCLCHPLLIAVVLSTGLYTVAASLTVFYLTGGVMDAIVLTMPPLVYVAAVSGAIHLANYYRELVPEVGVQRAPWQAVRAAALPLFLATITTGVGLLSLAISELIPIRTLGVYSAVGVFVGLGCILLLVPATLQLWPVLPPGEPLSPANRPIPKKRTRRGFDWSVLTRTAIAYPGVVSVATLALMGLAAWGFTRVETSVQIMRLFSPEAKILRDYAWLEQRLGPLAPVEIVVRFEPDCPLDMRQRVELVDRIQTNVNNLEHVGNSLSAATFAPDLESIDRRARRVGGRLLGGRYLRNTINKELLERHYPDFVRSGFLREVDGAQLWRITARVAALADVDYYKFSQQLDHVLRPLLVTPGREATPGVSLTYTGVLPIVYRAENSLLGGMIIGYTTDVLMLAVTMVVVVRSLSAGVLLLLPSVLPALLVFGAMGFAGIVVDMGTVMPPAVALGVTVDDIMHYLLRVRDSIRAGHGRREAILEGYRHCGRAMYQSWAILASGTLAFSFSPFAPTRRFGYVMVALLTVGLIGNLVFLPALLASPLGALWERTVRRKALAAGLAGQPRESAATPLETASAGGAS
jgi:predicted RND superfamily exporter protein